jgi:preprotein translocase subunit SecF
MSAFGRLYRGETKVDFIGKRNIWFAISAVVLLIGIGSMVFRQFNLGIEFAGGVAIQAPVADDGPAGELSDTDVIAELRSELAEFEAENAQIQVASGDEGRIVIVQTREISDPEMQQNLRSTVSEAVGATSAETTFESVGRKWGEEITGKALRALAIFLVVILAFISWRFDLKMAIASIVALLHDLVVTAGMYSLAGFEVTPSTVIAILTILGYSLYDTVVVFDIVDEDTSRLATAGKTTYQEAANVSMNRVFARSLNTSMTTLIPVAALLFVGAGLAGAETLKDLALALFVGILAGTYSSMYIATPLLSVMKEREPRYRNVREKVLREAKRKSGQSTLATAGAEGTDVPVTASAGPASRPSEQARPKAGSKKAKRRKRR